MNFADLFGGAPAQAPAPIPVPGMGPAASPQALAPVLPGPPVPAPAPAPANIQERVSGWAQVFEKLNDPNVQRGLLAFSQVTGGSMRPGESGIGQLARGVNAGTAAYDTSRYQQSSLEREREQAEQQTRLNESTLLTQEQSRSNSKTQQKETEQRMGAEAELRPLKLKEIQTRLKAAEQEADAKTREERLAVIKQNFIEAVNAGGENLDWRKLSPVERSWLAEMQKQQVDNEYKGASTEWMRERSRGEAATNKAPTGAAIAADRFTQLVEDIKLTDPKISAMPDGPKKDALARLTISAMTQTGSKPLAAEMTAEGNAQQYLDSYRIAYDNLPVKKRSKLTFQQYVNEEVSGIMAPDELSKNPSLKAQIIKGSAAPASPRGTDVLQQQGEATGYNGVVLPMPKSAADAVDGGVYQTPRGLGRWNASRQTFTPLGPK